MRILFRKKDDESELLANCRRGDRNAQAALYERFSRKMMSVCLRYVADRMEAEDLLVNSFLKVFEKIGSFREEGSLEGWIRRLVVNECLMHLRRHKSLHLSVDIDDSYDLTTGEDAGSNLAAEELLEMVARLPAGYRTVFNLYAIEGYSHQEIADSLGISENTSKSQLSRARTLLQKYISQHEAALQPLYLSHGN